MTSHRIAIVEDDAGLRERLARIVAATPGLELAAALGTCAEAREWLRTHAPPAVLLVDLGLPDGSGVDLIRIARALTPPPEIMVVSVFGDERHVIAAIEAGAAGYLLKDSPQDEMGGAILRLIDGESPISSAIARHVLRRFHTKRGGAPAGAPPLLTPRETQVLQLIAKGFSYSESAETLGMSPNTLTSHIKSIYGKLEVQSRGQAVFEALQLGLIDLPK